MEETLDASMPSCERQGCYWGFSNWSALASGHGAEMPEGERWARFTQWPNALLVCRRDVEARRDSDDATSWAGHVSLESALPLVFLTGRLTHIAELLRKIGDSHGASVSQNRLWHGLLAKKPCPAS